MYNEFNPEEFKKSLVQARKKAGLTQRQVEGRIGVRKLTLYDYESGRLKPPYDLLVKLANLYKSSVEDLLGLKKENDKEGVDFQPSTVPLIHLGIVGNNFQRACGLISKDPVVLSDIGLNEDDFHLPLLHLVTKGLTERQRRNYLIEFLKYINSLMGRDNKVSEIERSFRDSLLDGLEINLTEKEKESIRRAITKTYFGKSVKDYFPRPSLKHFLIWGLYLMAYSDRYLDHRENDYIKKVGEHIKMREKDVSFIKNKIGSYSEGKEVL